MSSKRKTSGWCTYIEGGSSSYVWLALFLDNCGHQPRRTALCMDISEMVRRIPLWRLLRKFVKESSFILLKTSWEIVARRMRSPNDTVEGLVLHISCEVRLTDSVVEAKSRLRNESLTNRWIYLAVPTCARSRMLHAHVQMWVLSSFELHSLRTVKCTWDIIARFLTCCRSTNMSKSPSLLPGHNLDVKVGLSVNRSFQPIASWDNRIYFFDLQ